MTMTNFTLAPGITTRHVNTVIKAAIDRALAEFGDLSSSPSVVPGGPVEADCRVDTRQKYETTPNGVRKVPNRRYIYGIHTGLRDTMVGHYDVGSGVVGLCFPSDYAGWDSASTYDRLRVRIWDLILHHPHPTIGHIHDVATAGVKVA